MAVPGLHCCATFSSCSKAGYSLVVVCGLLIAVASLAEVCRLQSLVSVVVAHGLSCMWNLRRPGMKPVSPALAKEFLTTGPPG